MEKEFIFSSGPYIMRVTIAPFLGVHEMFCDIIRTSEIKGEGVHLPGSTINIQGSFILRSMRDMITEALDEMLLIKEKHDFDMFETIKK
jgi:hypothetical protein